MINSECCGADIQSADANYHGKCADCHENTGPHLKCVECDKTEFTLPEFIAQEGICPNCV